MNVHVRKIKQEDVENFGKKFEEGLKDQGQQNLRRNRSRETDN